jgi:asparagine synthase (glutamine-hydrolysing)
MAAADGKVQIVFNGEIYNFPELRDELEKAGHAFLTNSDTETILMAYLQWGEACVERLNGMFAFGIWDARTKKIFLTRDRVGKKPLYYHWDGKTFSFASELKALLAGSLIPDQLDPEALDCYFTFGYIPAPKTVFKEVQKLKSAHTLSVSEQNLIENRYWTLHFSPVNKLSLQEAVEEFEDLLDKSVQCRLMSEVPLGAFLSGGLDSTLVVSAMAKRMTQPVLTNTIGFDLEEYNELPLARSVANQFHTDHHEFTVQPNAIEVLDSISLNFDEPFADSSALPTWYVCKMAKQNVTVALSGDGGDEGFGGYTFRYLPHCFEAWLRSRLPTSLRCLVFGGLGAVYPASAWLPKKLRLKTILENLAVSDAEAFYDDLVFLRADARKKLYSAAFFKSLHGFEPEETVIPLYRSNDAPHPLGRAQFTDIHFYMTDDVLVKVDRMSMAHSLEVRSPLLDYRILEFGARLPVNLKINNREGKVLLREVAAKRLPKEIAGMPKKGFSIPVAKWLRGDLKNYVEQHIFHKDSLIWEYLGQKELKIMWQEHQQGKRDHNVFLWGLLMLRLWEKKYFS